MATAATSQAVEIALKRNWHHGPSEWFFSFGAQRYSRSPLFSGDGGGGSIQVFICDVLKRWMDWFDVQTPKPRAVHGVLPSCGNGCHLGLTLSLLS